MSAERLAAGAAIRVPVGLSGGPRFGVVESYEASRGLGVVRPDDDGGVLPFHGTALGGGARVIEAGSPVVFVSRAAHGGVVEAACVRSLAAPQGVTTP